MIGMSINLAVEQSAAYVAYALDDFVEDDAPAGIKSAEF